MKPPHLKYEKKLWRQNFLVVGVDEAGRGALAGPVVAAACLFPKDKGLTRRAQEKKIKIADSKKLTPRQRIIAFQWIKKNCLAWSLAEIGVGEINKIGIGKASLKAMTQAVKQLKSKVNQQLNGQRLFVLSDYYQIPYLKKVGIGQQNALVFGDRISFSIASASIIAKVARDKLMVKLAGQYPFYRWEKNKGYGTEEHRKRIKKYGINKYHRKAFVRKINY